MIRRLEVAAGAFGLALLGLASACQSGTPAGARAERVVMVSYDGVGAELAWDWIFGGVASENDGLAAMAEHGLAAERLRMAAPTLTAVNHATLVTGKLPQATGIVSNTFHRPGTPILERVSGFATSIEADTLWAAARRRGIRVGTLPWPGVDARALDRVADFGVLWPDRPLAPSAILELDPELASTRDDLPSRDGVTTLGWSITVELADAEPARVDLEVAVLDGTRDERPRYDTVACRLGGEEEWLLAGEREWFAVEVSASGPGDYGPRRYAIWSKGLHIDRFRGALRLYRGAAWRLHAYPNAFEGRLSEAVGPWPGTPDGDLLEEWWLDLARGIDLDTFLEQAERLDRYLDEVARWVIASEEFGLLLAYHPAPDSYQHASLIVEQDQWGYSEGKAVAAAEGLKRIGRSVDLSVATLWRSLEPERDALVAVSDHGHLPLHDLVLVNRVLADAGLVELDDDGWVAPSSPMAAAASGGCAHLYLNLAGREPAGVVAPDEVDPLLRRAARALAGLTVDGEPVVERVLTRSEAAAIGLDHEASGDLIAFARPGFGFTGRTDGAAIEPSAYYGQHGYLPSHDATCGMLFARGPGIGRARRAEMRATEVAPMVASWLGVELR